MAGVSSESSQEKGHSREEEGGRVRSKARERVDKPCSFTRDWKEMASAIIVDKQA